MASNLNFLRSEIAPTPVLVAVDAWSCAVAVTAEELLIAKSGALFWKKKLERYPRAEVTGVTIRPNPNADVVSIELTDGRSLGLMFSEPAEREGGQRLVAILEASLSGERQVRP